MPYTSLPTVGSGDTGTSAWANLVDTNLDFLANPPACRVYHSATQSLADNAFTALVFNSEAYDTDGMHSTSVATGRITFNTAGLYLVTFHGTLDVGTYNHAEVNLRLNGATTIATGDNMDNATTTFGKTVGFSTVYKFAAAQYVELRIFQDNAANAARNLTAGPDGNGFTATWIGLG